MSGHWFLPKSNLKIARPFSGGAYLVQRSAFSGGRLVGRTCATLFLSLLPFALLCLPHAVYAADNVYLQELIQQAREKNLAQRSEWLNLLHYKPYPYRPGMRSLADDRAFFNAPDGRTHNAFLSRVIIG
jgi:hypothetical protein